MAIPSLPLASSDSQGLSYAFGANVLAYGARGDGVTDDTAAIQNAIDAKNAAGGGSVLLPGGTYLVTGLTHKDNVIIVGEHKQATTIKLADSSDDDVIGGTATDCGVKDLKIDGNSANNTTGSAIDLSGRRNILENIDIINAPEHGVHHNYTGGGGLELGNAYFMKDIVADSSGKHGFFVEAPSDGVMEACISIDASDSADNTYDGFHFETTAKMSGCHAWNDATGNRHRYALYEDSFGMQCINSYFEGGKTANAFLTGQNGVFCNILLSAAGGGKTLIIEGTEYNIEGRMGSKLSGAANPIGVVLGTSTTSASANRVVMTQTNQLAGVVDFTYSSGGNHIDIVGFNSSAATLTVGSPNASDRVYIDISGTGFGSLTQYPEEAVFTGNVTMSGLPTSSPSSGRLWNNSSDINIG